jgi:hypothetical protein
LWVPPAPKPSDTNTPVEVLEWVASLGAPGSIITRSVETAADHAALGYALGQGLVELVRDSTTTDANCARVAKINQRILDRASDDAELSVLASHLTGSGVEVGWWTLALLASMRVDVSVESVIDRVLAQADHLGIVLARQGFVLTPEEARQELRTRYSVLQAQAKIFTEGFVI